MGMVGILFDKKISSIMEVQLDGTSLEYRLVCYLAELPCGFSRGNRDETKFPSLVKDHTKIFF